MKEAISPSISVIMAVRNQADYLKAAIKSILAQTFSDFEFIIINDGSIDRTKEIILSFDDKRIKYFENRRIGLTKSLNKGLQLAQGKYIARMDADDISAPYRLEKQFRYLENSSDIVLVGSWIKFFVYEKEEEGQVWKCPQGSGLINYLLFYGNQLAHSSIFFRRQEILQMGGYNEDIEFAQDYDLYCRLIKKYKINNIPEVLVKYRVHKNSISFNKIKRAKQAKYAQEINYNLVKQIIKNLTRQDHDKFYKTFVLNRDIKVGFKDLFLFLKNNRKIFSYFLRRNLFNDKEEKEARQYYQNQQKRVLKIFLE